MSLTAGKVARGIAVCAVCAAALFGVRTPATAQGEPAAQASVENASLGALRQTLAAAQSRLGEVDAALSATASALAAQQGPAQRSEIEQRRSAAHASLQHERETLGRLAQAANKAGLAADDLRELQRLSEALPDGGLPAQLRALGESLDKSGSDRSRAGLNADAYRKLAADFAGAAEQLRKQIHLAVNRAQLGASRQPGEDARFQQLVAQFGEDFAAAAIYVPTSEPIVFRPAAPPDDKSPGFALIWDEAGGEWHRVNGEVPVETIFRDAALALGRALTPGQLKYLADNYVQVETRRAMAAVFGDYLREAAREEGGPQNEAFARLKEAGGVRTALAPPEMFHVKFIYDGQFRAWALEQLDQLRADLVRQGAPAQAALQQLDALLDQHNVTLDSQWAQGAVPAVAAVRVVAWEANRPNDKYASTWKFDKEKVSIEIAGGYGHGTRKGNVVQSEGSLPGRNCTATDVRTFKEGGTLTFTATYTCTAEDGTTKVTEVSGAGTWQLVSDRPTTGQRRGR
jgi:hypothetical protein